jgi:4-amino-4-deoxy-L-arabinose transferase-like glycosyltransferase
MNGTELTRRAGRSDWLALFALAFALRLAAGVFTGRLLHPELFEYDAMARNWLAGRGLTYTHLGVVYYSFAPPLHAWLTAASYWLTGSIVPVMLIQIGAGAAIAVAAAAVAERVFGSRLSGWAAGALVAVHPGLLIYSATKAHPLPFDALFFTLVLLQFMRLHERATPSRAALLGLLIGLGTLSRSTMLIFPPIGAIWLVLASPRHQRVPMIRIVAIAAVVSVAVILPWSIRDSLVHHRSLFTLISTHGEDFWDGNNPLATGHSYIDRNLVVINALPPAERAELESQPDEIAQSEWFMGKAKAFIREHPGAAARLTLLKFFHFWWFAPQTGVLYPPAWRYLYMAFYAGTLLLAAVGIARLRATAPSTVPLAILVGLFLLGLSVVQSVYYVEARHRWAIEPMLLALSGGGVAALAGRHGRHAS